MLQGFLQSERGNTASAAFSPEDGDKLRLLARQLAAESDTAALLEILCDAGAAQCDASGAAVVQVIGGEAEVVAAIGKLAIARSKRFPLPGSLAREVIRTRDVVAVTTFSESDRPLQQVVPALRIGPMLLGPLIAHDNLLGVLVATRDLDGAAFGDREAHRVRAIADYAALALWKAEMLERAQAADRAKSRFLATISHELRTPLTALSGYSELLADQILGPLSDGQLDVVDRIRAVTGHLAAVIEEVLTFSSLDEGREVVRATDFLAADLVRGVAIQVDALARQKKLSFCCSIPDAPIRISSDPDKIRQILMILANNAIKFTDAGDVRIELSRQDGEITFAVVDTGIGIAEREMPRLFKPFAQLDPTLTRRHGGTGLGLYIARGLAELLGGRIDLHSTVGKGSTFVLALPG